MLLDAYDEVRDPDSDPDFRTSPTAAAKLLPVILMVKQQFSVSCMNK